MSSLCLPHFHALPSLWDGQPIALTPGRRSAISGLLSLIEVEPPASCGKGPSPGVTPTTVATLTPTSQATLFHDPDAPSPSFLPPSAGLTPSPRTPGTHMLSSPAFNAFVGATPQAVHALTPRDARAATLSPGCIPPQLQTPSPAGPHSAACPSTAPASAPTASAPRGRPSRRRRSKGAASPPAPPATVVTAVQAVATPDASPFFVLTVPATPPAMAAPATHAPDTIPAPARAPSTPAAAGPRRVGRKTDFVARKLPNSRNKRGVTGARMLVNRAAGIPPSKRWRHGIGSRDTAINGDDARKIMTVFDKYFPDYMTPESFHSRPIPEAVAIARLSKLSDDE